MKTYTQRWSADRVVERAVGDRRDNEPKVLQGNSIPSLDEWTKDQQFNWFVPDIINSMIYSPYRDGKSVRFKIESADRDIEMRVAKAVQPAHPFHGRDRYPNLGDAIRDWMKQTWHDVAKHGRSVHEIAPLLRPNVSEANEPTGFALVRVDPRGIGRRWGRWGHLVHRTSTLDQRERGLPKVVRLDGGRFTVFSLPSNLDRIVREAVVGLRGRTVGSVLTITPWAHPELYELGYSMSDHDAVRDAVVSRATRETGWHGRGQFSDHITGHYLVRRMIRLGRFTTRLRNAFLAHLNQVLAREVGSLGGRVKVVALNAFDIPDFEEAERKLDSGEYSFREVRKVIGG